MNLLKMISALLYTIVVLATIIGIVLSVLGYNEGERVGEETRKAEIPDLGIGRSGNNRSSLGSRSNRSAF